MFALLLLLSTLGLWICPALGQSSLCSWVETSSRWSAGQRNILKINVDQHYESWDVTFSFDIPLTFEVKQDNNQTTCLTGDVCRPGREM